MGEKCEDRETVGMGGNKATRGKHGEGKCHLKPLALAVAASVTPRCV